MGCLVTLLCIVLFIYTIQFGKLQIAELGFLEIDRCFVYNNGIILSEIFGTPSSYHCVSVNIFN